MMGWCSEVDSKRKEGGMSRKAGSALRLCMAPTGSVTLENCLMSPCLSF